jgi:hypothetical protein
MAISAAAKLAKALANASKKKADGIIGEDEWIKANPYPFPNKKWSEMSASERTKHSNWRERKKLATDPEYRERRISRNRVESLPPEEVERRASAARDRYQKNREHNLKKKKEYLENNREEINRKQRARQQRKYYADIEASRTAKAIERAQRRAATDQRSPPWRNSDEIDEIYRTSAEISKATGVPHHVDHVIPLRGKHVSGMHHQDNLFIIPQSENARKNNIFEPGDLPPAGGVQAARSLLEEILKSQGR